MPGGALRRRDGGRIASWLHREVAIVKATILLAIALFLATAPAPDSATIAQATANFIVLESHDGLQAADLTQATRHRSRPGPDNRTEDTPGHQRGVATPRRAIH